MLLPFAQRSVGRERTTVTFSRAPRVQPRESVSSRQLAGLATSFNDRLRSGLGDPTWRIAFYLAGAFRQMRNPDSSGMLWPAQHEFFTAYQMRPETDGEWPLSGPGEPEGANVTNPINAWIWGNDGMRAAAESDRLAAMPWTVDGRSPATPGEFWTLGCWQRGGADLSTGAVASPALDAARSWSSIRFSRYSPHGNAYGGWLALPALGSTCHDPDPTDLDPPPPNYQIKFTRIVEAASTSGLHHASEETDSEGRLVILYAGTCWPVDIDDDGIVDYQNHIAGIAVTPWAYYVVLNSGDVDVLPAADWIEGPYAGSVRLAKTQGDHLPRIMNAFAREFRGSAQQIAAAETLYGRTERPGTWNAKAFDTRQFMGRQYLLAPARGRQIGENILVEYPRAAWRPGSPPYRARQGDLAILESGDQSGTSYRVNDGCVLAGCFFRAERLGGPVTVEILASGVTAATVTLTPGGGTAEALRWLRHPVAAGSTISLRLATPANWSASDGLIEATLAELIEYQPDVSDLFLALRVIGALENL